jgi:integrase
MAGLPLGHGSELTMAKSHDVNIWKIAVRKNRSRGHGVRWSVAGNEFSKWFTTRALADNHRAGLLHSIRQGEAFDTESGLAESAIREQQSVSWFDLACRFVDMKWPQLAAKSRISIADALATITPALVTTTRGMPDQDVLRAALYRWAFNKESRTTSDPDPDIASAITWIRAHTLNVAALDEKDRRSDLIRRALDALSVTMAGRPAAATVVARKRAVFYSALGYAVELDILPANPLDKVRWKAPSTADQVDRRVVASPGQITKLLDAVTADRPELVAFFACLYYSFLRPAEAAALTLANCYLPKKGWGRLTLTSSAKRVPAAWTDDGTPLDQRQLKHRARDAIRVVPIPPVLVAILRHHIDTFELASDGRLFQVIRGQRGKGAVITAKIYGPSWQKARAKALPAAQQASPLAARPYDLRHGGITLALNAGVPAPEVAARAGHSVEVLWRVYAGCIDGHDQLWNDRIDQALDEQDDQTGD